MTMVKPRRRKPSRAPARNTDAQACPTASPSGAGCADDAGETRSAEGYEAELPDLDAREAGRSSSRKAAGPPKRARRRRRIDRRSAEAAETYLDGDTA